MSSRISDIPPTEGLRLRTMRGDEWAEVAELIYLSTNAWYQAKRGISIFTGDPSACEIFCATYEALDPDCCLVVENTRTGRIVGSCFYHPRPTHISIGIVNTHPNYFGRGIARRMLDQVIGIAERDGKPLRLVSSAMNLDSYSLYTRAGFVPRMAFQDMFLPVPPDGLTVPPLSENDRIRPAAPEDAPAMAALEQELVGIEREKDYRHFLENRDGIWSASVLEGEGGGIDGFLVSVAHPASNMLGPGVARAEEGAAALIHAELNRHHRGRQPVFLVPVTRANLVQRLYGWGAKNCEIHFAQVRGAWTEPTGVVMPTFLPETG
jgi:ribosomal protein S18 acetylase RimI-like enzyme